MRLFLLISASLILFSCNASTQKQTDQRPLLNDSWMLVSINGQNISIDPEKDGIKTPSLEISVSEMKYTGTDGCNQYMGSLTELDEEVLKFGLAAGTRMMCLDMAIPDEFNKTLGLVFSYEIKDQTLSLLNENGEELMQLKKEADPS
jgi:heat shock protein HslJ